MMEKNEDDEWKERNEGEKVEERRTKLFSANKALVPIKKVISVNHDIPTMYEYQYMEEYSIYYQWFNSK